MPAAFNEAPCVVRICLLQFYNIVALVASNFVAEMLVQLLIGGRGGEKISSRLQVI